MTDRLSPIDARQIVSLEVDGVRHEGWKTVRVRHAIDQLAGVFSLEVHDRWPGATQAFGIEPLSACTLKVGSDVLITGYVDSNEVTATKSDHSITIEGRDKTGDLVDCSAPVREWGGQPFEAIAVELCRPYGVKVFTQLATGENTYKGGSASKSGSKISPAGKGGCTLPRKASNTGETVHRLLEKLCKIQGCLMMSDRRGGLIITRAGLGGRATDKLVQGQNILSISFSRSAANLFSEITVKGQHHGATPATGGIVLSGAGAVKPKATVNRSAGASNSGVTASNAVNRYRPLIIAAEDQADAARCKSRAQWEAGTREGKAKKLTIKVQGWRQSDGRLWEVNTLVNVVCPYVRESDDMLVQSVEYSLDFSGGTTATLVLFSPSAFDVLPEIPKPSVGKSSKKNTGVNSLSGAGSGR